MQFTAEDVGPEETLWDAFDGCVVELTYRCDEGDACEHEGVHTLDVYVDGVTYHNGWAHLRWRTYEPDEDDLGEDGPTFLTPLDRIDGVHIY